MKYKYTGKTSMHKGRLLHQIVCVTPFGEVKAGELGGWIQKKSNLSQKGNSWIKRNAKVYDDSKIYDDAVIGGFTEVCEQAEVFEHARTYGQPDISGRVKIHGHSVICNFSQIGDDAEVYEHAQILGFPIVGGTSEVCGNVSINGNAKLLVGVTRSQDDYVVIGPIGEYYSFITLHIPTGFCASSDLKINGFIDDYYIEDNRYGRALTALKTFTTKHQ